MTAMAGLYSVPQHEDCPPRFRLVPNRSPQAMAHVETHW